MGHTGRGGSLQVTHVLTENDFLLGEQIVTEIVTATVAVGE